MTKKVSLAKAVLIALRKAGYSITKVEDQNTPKPNDEKLLPTSSGMPFVGPRLLARAFNCCGL